MNHYLHLENQQLLWKIMNKSAIFLEINNKEEIFKEIIKTIYEKYKNNLDLTEKKDLFFLNKETIVYLKKNVIIKRQLQRTPTPTPPPTPPPTPTRESQTEQINNTQNSANFVNATETNTYFGVMTGKYTDNSNIPQPDFSPIKDEIIDNFDEILEKQKRERDELTVNP